MLVNLFLKDKYEDTDLQSHLSGSEVTLLIFYYLHKSRGQQLALHEGFILTFVLQHFTKDLKWCSLVDRKQAKYYRDLHF